MKKNISVLVFCLISIFMNAHDINYEKVILKHWIIEKENKAVDGSFFMLKNSIVFIEAKNGSIIKIPFAALSTEDQAYVLQKNEKVRQMNSRLLQTGNEPIQTKAIFNDQFWFVIALLFGFIWFVFLGVDKKKINYLIPILVVGVCITLFSFTTKVMKALGTTSSNTFIDSAFAPFKPNINTFWDSTYFYVESLGIPSTHEMMVGISNHGWQQQVPIPQCYIGSNAWPIPLNPVFATNPIPVDSVHFTRGAIAIAVNGVPIFNVHTNTGVDSYLDGQLDNYGGHCGRADDYHYHIAPLHLYSYTSSTLPIAFGLDGYGVYGNVEPDGTAMQTLDANHGHFYHGDYHYHGTTTSPYMIAKMAGQVTEDISHQLVPQPSAHPVRPSLTPLNGALITSCTPNLTKNGYNITYTKNGLTDSVVYSWTTNGQYTFTYFTNGNLDSTKKYNGFVPCSVPLSTGFNEYSFSSLNAFIFPNPNNGVFHLQLSNITDQRNVKSISIYNLKGEMVFHSLHFISDIEIRNIANGIYYLKIQFPNNQLTQKLIIQ